MLKSTKSRVIAGVVATMAMAGAIAMFTLTGEDVVTLPPASAAIIGVQAPLTTSWFDTNEIERVKLHVTGCASPPPTSDADLNRFVLDQYYDLTMTAYIAAQRTGDSVLLAAARKCADSWWQHPQWIGSGTIRKWPDEVTPSPRHAGIGGLSLRALDGRPEMWSWIVGYTQFHLDHWLKKRVTSPALFYGLREGAFALHYAVWVAQTLPDSHPNAAAIRAQLVTDIDNVVINYFGRLQQPDGSWRWDDVDFVDSDGGTLKGVMQPFMVGLLLGALTDAYNVVTPAGKESIKQQMAKACRHLFEGGPYIKDQVVPNFNVKVRGFHYFYHGGTSVNPTRYAAGDIPPNWNTPEKWHVESARQAISTILPAYGFVYTLTGDPWFKAAGDELFDAAYGGGDGFRAMAADTAKNYNQHYRLNGRYLVWRGGAPAPSPTATLPPSPSPSMTVTPTATPTATPTPTVAPTATPTPVPTATPRPSPTALPCCPSGTRPGSPAVCRCCNGFRGNSGLCR